ncbi:uncharacterized protein LOC110813590 [Carica papaya]|uniref:uncharacterized protein LOC110813590 n=1 Tax=Carica papaya TaxID=3649 RepID=UPI000B8CD62C|nr:uncharacterized protein LOC110813590 [Carica papaya]
MMNGLYREDNSCCYFHPKQIVVGVCALCLNERLLILAAKQSHGRRSSSSTSSARSSGRKNIQTNFPKIFAFTSLLSRQWKSDHNSHHHHDAASTSHEESFISIKFEENGVASWEKGTVSKVSLEHCSMSWNNHSNKSVIEHAKSRSPLRWRRRIGHLFHLIRLKRSTACHVAAKVEGVKVRKQGWIRTLTKRKTTQEKVN